MPTDHHLEEAPAPDLSNAPVEAWLLNELPKRKPQAEWEHRLRKQVRFTDIYSESRRERRHIEAVNKQGAALPKRKATTANAQPQSNTPADAQWLLEQFQAFLTQLQLQKQQPPAAEAGQEEDGHEPEAEVKRIRPVRTPRSEMPMCTARPAELLEPEFCKGRLYFSCPCCRFPAALPVWLAGKKARCPRCYSAIRAPHPGRGLKTRVLENDVEALLHPERFEGYYNAHRLIPWIGLPRPKLHPSFHLTAVVIMVGMLCCWMPFALDRTGQAIQRLTALFQSTEQPVPEYKERATRLVEKFLSAEDAAAKSAYVRDAARVAPLMADWYRRQPGGSSVKARTIEASGTGFYSAGVSHPVTDVQVEMPDGHTASFTVEHAPDGDRIEWESSVGYSADFHDLLQKGSAAGPQKVRVLAALDDYYNFDFTSAATHICVRLHDPNTTEFLGYGYIPAGDLQVRRMLSELEGSSAEDLRLLLLEVEALDSSSRSHQVKIVGLVPENDPTAVADRGK